VKLNIGFIIFVLSAENNICKNGASNARETKLNKTDDKLNTI